MANKSDLVSLGQGTSIKGFSKDDLAHYLFCYPEDFKEQQKIADCLSSLDELIAAQARKVEALKGHKKGLMQLLFPAEGQTIPALRFPEFSEMGEWVQKSLEDVASYKNGKAYEPHIVEVGKYIVVNSRFISTDGRVIKYSNEDFCIADTGDVLMVLSDLPNGRALAKAFYVDGNNRYAVNQRVCKLTPRGIYDKFLYYLINRNPKLLAYDDGQSQTHLSKENVTQCQILTPRLLSEQQKIADCLSSLDELIAAQASKVEALKAHKKGLMQQLFPTHYEDAA